MTYQGYAFYCTGITGINWNNAEQTEKPERLIMHSLPVLLLLTLNESHPDNSRSFIADCIACDRATNRKRTSVVDGDTFHLLFNGKVIVAMLTNIDAPEWQQRFGRETQAEVNRHT